jgi:hypothetical protein
MKVAIVTGLFAKGDVNVKSCHKLSKSQVKIVAIPCSDRIDGEDGIGLFQIK